MGGNLPTGRVLVYDDDHFYMGGVLAELLAQQGCEVTLATPAAMVSDWTQYTLEQERIQDNLASKGIQLLPQHTLKAILPQAATLSNALSRLIVKVACDAVVLLSDRLPNDALHQALKPALAEKKFASLQVIGDAQAPHIIAQAVFSGYRAAVEFGEPPQEGTPFLVERAAL